MVKPEDVYLLLFLQAGSQEAMTRKLQNFFFFFKKKTLHLLEEVDGTLSTSSVLLDPSG